MPLLCFDSTLTFLLLQNIMLTSSQILMCLVVLSHSYFDSYHKAELSNIRQAPGELSQLALRLACLHTLGQHMLQL